MCALISTVKRIGLEMNRKNMLASAVQAAQQAGNLLAEFDRDDVETAIGKDIKHKADKAAEAVIIEQLRSYDIPILSEEKGESESFSAEGLFWIVDPLDGTMNYSRSNPFSCVSIALWDGKQPVLGVIYDFNRDELFSGIVGEGAWVNGSEMSVSNTKEKAQAILATGFPSYREFSDESLREFIEQVQMYKKIRMFGAAALSLAYVACGRVDVYIESDIMLWDVAAGLALVCAAGGTYQLENSSRGSWLCMVNAGAALELC